MPRLYICICWRLDGPPFQQHSIMPVFSTRFSILFPFGLHFFVLCFVSGILCIFPLWICRVQLIVLSCGPHSSLYIYLYMHLSYILGGSGRGRGMSHRQETRSWVPLAPIYLRVFSLHISCSFVFHSISSVSNFFSFYQVFLDANQWAGSGRLGVGGRWRIFLGKGDKVKARSFALT